MHEVHKGGVGRGIASAANQMLISLEVFDVVEQVATIAVRHDQAEVAFMVEELLHGQRRQLILHRQHLVHCHHPAANLAMRQVAQVAQVYLVRHNVRVPQES